MLQVTPEKTLEVVKSNQPHNNYVDFQSEIQRAICAGMDIPYALVTGDWGSVNYSSGQLFSVDYNLRLQRLQNLVLELERWWTRTFLWDAMVRGDLKLRPAKFEALMESFEWNPSVAPPAEPMKAAKADEMLLAMGIKSRRQIATERGLNFDEQMRQAAEDEKEYGPPPGKNMGATGDEDEKDADDADNDGEDGGKKESDDGEKK